MLSGGEDFPLSQCHVLLPSRHNEDGFLPAHRRLDVCVRLGAEGLDFATWKIRRKKKAFE